MVGNRLAYANALEALATGPGVLLERLLKAANLIAGLDASKLPNEVREEHDGVLRTLQTALENGDAEAGADAADQIAHVAAELDRLTPADAEPAAVANRALAG